MINYRAKLQPNKVYHIFNHAVGNEHLFRNEKNYYFFLEKYFEYISPIAYTYAYCLMPNHFHFLLKIKPESLLKKSGIFEMSKSLKNNLSDISNILSKQFKNLFRSYTGSYDKIYERRGTLLEPRFKRLLVDSKEYFINAMNYIHQNPIHHSFVDNIEDWKFSSFTNFYSDNDSKLQLETVYKLFENKTDFIKNNDLQNAVKYSLELELSY